jgi:hypothetical protein
MLTLVSFAWAADREIWRLDALFVVRGGDDEARTRDLPRDRYRIGIEMDSDGVLSRSAGICHRNGECLQRCNLLTPKALHSLGSTHARASQASNRLDGSWPGTARSVGVAQSMAPSLVSNASWLIAAWRSPDATCE